MEELAETAAQLYSSPVPVRATDAASPFAPTTPQRPSTLTATRRAAPASATTDWLPAEAGDGKTVKLSTAEMEAFTSAAKLGAEPPPTLPTTASTEIHDKLLAMARAYTRAHGAPDRDAARDLLVEHWLGHDDGWMRAAAVAALVGDPDARFLPALRLRLKHEQEPLILTLIERAIRGAAVRFLIAAPSSDRPRCGPRSRMLSSTSLPFMATRTQAGLPHFGADSLTKTHGCARRRPTG